MTTALPRPLVPVPSIRFTDGARPRRRGRSLLGYLVMPRPGDMVKALLMPLTFLLGVLANGGADGRTLVRAVLVLIVLEFLVYPARYQWNDVRGFAADQRHPGGDRGRLPGPLSMARSRILASAAVAALRLAVAAGVAFLPGLDLGGPVLATIAGVFGVAAVYEALRAVGTGRHAGAGTPPVTPAVAALWVTIGAGYAVRGLLGLGLAVDLSERPALALAAAVMLWAYGVAFVTSRWAVESLAHARCDGRRVRWAAEASHAREHLLALTRWLPSAVDGRTPLDRWAVLRERTPMLAPWNVALTLAGAAAAVTGLLLSADALGTTVSLVAVLGGAAALSVAGLPRLRLPAAALGALILLGVFAAVLAERPLVAVLPWAGVMAAYLHFSAQSPASMGHLGRMARGGLVRALTPPARLLIGHRTWQALANGDGSRG
jgi:hypothetical protein